MKNDIASLLLQIKAVFLRPDDPFTWASGIKSPIYCDNRLTLSYPDVREKIEDGFAELIKKHFNGAEALFGTATAGIAHAAITAHLLGLPMGYVRSSDKNHGRKNRIEGHTTPNMKVVVIEDLISTGGSVIDACKALRESGCEVLGIVSIFTYGMKKGLTRLQEAGLNNYSLCDFDTLVQVASESGYIKSEDISRLLRFRDNPEDECWRC